MTNKPPDPAKPNVGVNMNRDPVTGAPGSHPAGAGVGAAVGATVGGAVGAVGGPLGIAAGAAIGGVAGGLVGKGAAEAINPTGEVEYWRAEFTNRPYSSGRTFDDFAPAYYYAAESYQRYPGRTFEEAETDLARDWPNRRANSRLEWNDARAASKDAWERIAKSSRDRVSDAEHQAAHEVNDLISLLYDGKMGFEQAAEKVENSTIKSGLREFARQRDAFISELKPLVAYRGEEPDHSGSGMGAVHRGWIGLKSALGGGDHAILAECERGEDSAVEKYRSLLDSTSLTPAFQGVIRRQYSTVQQTHDRVKQWRDSLA
ncbi:MAG: PA2169 family four-helix-bundle protein [Phycisphaerales bacterium]